MNNYTKLLHGSAISNANVLDDVIKGKADEFNYKASSRSKSDGDFSRLIDAMKNERELANKPHCSRSDNISNAKQHSSHDRADKAMFASTNEGKNEGLPGLLPRHCNNMR